MDTIVQTLNTAGRAFVHFALPMLLQSSLLILLLLALDTLLRRRVRAVFRYWIWMLVLVKLVLPPSLWSPVSIGTWVGDELEVSTAALLEPEPASPAEVPSAARPSAAAHILSAPDPMFVTRAGPIPEDESQPSPWRADDGSGQARSQPSEVRESAPAAEPPHAALTWQGLLLLAWVATVASLLLLLLQRAYFVRGLVAQAGQADQRMLGVLEECRAHLGLRRAVALRLSPNATSPAVCGLWRPTILIPQSLAPRLHGRDLRAVLLHELAHIRRGDLWVNLAQTLLQIVYFYHPLLWLANAVMRRAREQAVDETVLVALGETAAQYPETLVNVAKLAFRRRPVLSLRLVGVVESKSALSARIKHMLSRPLPRTAKLGLLGLSAVVVIAAILLPMAAATERPLSDNNASPLEIRFVGVCPDQSGDILDAAGKKVEEMPYPLAGWPVWQPDRLRRDFVFEVPETPEPALFVRYRFDGPAGWWQQADRTPLAPVQVSGRRLLFVSEELPRVWRKPILGILPRNIPLDKMDITLGYFYGPARQTRLSFAGPFQEGQALSASRGAQGQLTVLAPQPVMPQSEPRPRFRLQAPVVTDTHTMIVLYDTEGARHIAGWMKGRLPKDPGTTVDFSPADESLTLPQIARIAVEEPYELTVQNVRVSYPDRPARDHAAYLDVMAERLGLTALPPEELAKYQFANPQDAIAVIDILPAGDLARRAVAAIASAEAHVTISQTDEPMRDKLYAVAREWVDSSDLHKRVLGVRLGLLGDRPEFFARAITLLADDYHDLADTGSIQNDLDQLVWLLLNRHRAELTPQQRDALTLHLNGRRTLPILGSTSKATAPGTTVDTPGDSDGDGLSDFQETHKYLTDPTKKDSDGDGTPDGDWNERREYTYSVRTVMRYLPPFDETGLNDDFQDARVLQQTPEYVEIEVIHYPLATGYETVPENPNWRRDNARDARLGGYLAPGVTTNWDEQMRQDLLAALQADGIVVETLTDKQVVERVSSWLLKRSRSLDNVFTTYYVDYPQGTPRVYPGLEDAFRHEFERDSRNYDWSIEQHFDRELLGKGMFYNKTHGSCTSTAVYLTTVLRALGIPTRLVLATPVVDASDRAQVLMVKNAITHNRVRLTMLAGLGGSGHGFTNHTFNEVYVGNRWCRLDGSQLGCPAFGPSRFGLQTHLYTFNDLSDVNFAPTWGWRYAKREHSDIFQHDNPYTAVEVSELFGPHGQVPNPPFTAQDIRSYTEPDIFLFSPSRVSVWDEFIDLVGRATANKTGRPHQKEFYDNLFDGIWLTRPQDILVLLFSLDAPERVPAGYEDLLPRPWPEIESALQRGETVELDGQARGMNIVLLAAPTRDALKPLVQNSKRLNALGKTGGPAPALAVSSTRSGAGGTAAGSVARLDGGLTVELLGVCDYPSESKPWWRPDGSALDPAPYKTTNNKRELQEGFRDYELVVRYGGAPDMDIEWDVPGSAKTGVTGNPYDARGEQIGDLTVCTVRFPENQTCTDVHIGTAAGAWETRATHASLEREGTYALPDDKAVAFGIPYAKDGDTFVPVTTDLFSWDMAFRVVAIRGQGDVCSGGLSGSGGKKLNSLTYRFHCPLSDIREFRFQTRPWTWVKFRNVALCPGLKTGAQAKVMNGDEANGAPRWTPRQERVVGLGPAWEALRDTLGPHYGGSIGGFSTDEKRCARWFEESLDRAGPGGTLVLMFAFDQTAAVPPSYQDLLPLLWSEIESRVRRGEQVEAHGTARGLNVVLLAAPTLAQLNTLVRQTSLFAAFRPPAPAQAQAPGSISATGGPTGSDPTADRSAQDSEKKPFSVYGTVTDLSGSAGAKPEKRIVLPDVDRQPVMLDLATGDVVNIPKTTSPSDLGPAIEKLGRGDLVYDSGVLVLVRGAGSEQAQEGPVKPFRSYRIGGHLPEVLTVTTAEGHCYEIRILSTDGNGCTIKYAAVPSDESIRGRGAIEPRAGVGRLEFHLVPRPADMESWVLENYRKALAEGRSAPGGMFAWFELRREIAELRTIRSLIADERDGKPWLLLWNTASHAMFAGRGWGLEDVYETTDAMGRPAIGLTLNEEGARRFHELTRANVGRPLAIVLDGKVVSLPEVLSPLDGRQALIIGNFTGEEIRQMLTSLKAGMGNPPASQPGRQTAVETGVNPTADSPGPLGRHALSFDGVDDKLVVPPSPSLALASSFTIEVWCKGDPNGGLSPFVSLVQKGRKPNDPNKAQAGGFLLLGSFFPIPEKPGVGSLFLGNAEGKPFQVGLSGDPLPTRPGWIHVAARNTRTDYVPVSDQPLSIGDAFVPGSLSRPFKGEIAEIRLWNKALTDAEIESYASACLTGNEPNLVACWDFEHQAGGQVVYDITPNHNDARLGNSAGKDDADPMWMDFSDPVAAQNAEKARGSGVTDGSSGPPVDTLKRLLDAAQPGGVVTVPRGRYATPVEITKPVVLRGASQEGCIIEVTADRPAVLINAGGRGDVTVENLTIQWQRATDRRIERPTALLVKDTTARIHNCRFVPLGDPKHSPTAVYIEGRSKSIVDNCRFNGFEYTICQGPGTEGVVMGCLITDCGHQGVIAYDGATLSVLRCVITGSEFHAIRCTGGTLHLRDNLLINNANRGIYLGNKTGRGTITNNVILGNGSGISGFAGAEYAITNNVIMRNSYAGIDMRDSCRLKICNNALIDNQRGVKLHKEGAGNSNVLAGNIYWSNATDVEDIEDREGTVKADPQFADPNHGDFTVRGGELERYGLTDPQVIKDLWRKYEQAQRERPAGATRPTRDIRQGPSRPAPPAEAVGSEPATPVQDALKRLMDEARPGAVVTVPKGRHTMPVEITKPVVLRGASQEDCIIKVTADQPAVLINAGGPGDVTVENLTIQWQLATDKRIERPTALLVKDTNARIRNCRFVPLGDPRRSPTAVYIDGRSNSTVENCRFRGFEYTVCYGPNTQGVVQDCIITDCGHQGVINYDGSALTVQRCVITGSKFHAVRCTGGTLDVKDNLLIKNANRGIYLGNKTGRGTITNNVILGNGSGISGFGRAEYVIANNVVMDSQYAGIDMRDSCRLSIRNNVLAKNQRGLVLFKEGTANSNTVGKNAYWANATDVENMDKPQGSLTADPQFADPNHGDFTARGPARDEGQGLTNPEVIKQLWAKYEQLRQERPAQPAAPAEPVPSSVPSSSQAPEALAWQRTDVYVPPDPTSFFPDDPEGGRKLDTLFRATDKDSRSDEEILSTVRQGLRRTSQHRTLILRWIGNRYIWGKDPQNAQAIEIMYHAVPMERHYAIYFGLSVLKNKTPNVLRTLADICVQGEDVGRITWGIGSQREQLLAYITPHLQDSDPARQEIAQVLVKHFRGELDFGQWQRDKRLEQAKAQFGSQLPQFKETLRTGASDVRYQVLTTILHNPIGPLLDDSFLPALQAAGDDPDQRVRNEVARVAGGRWVWSAQEQDPNAIALMLKLSSDSSREVRYNAVYYGLSVVRDKTEPVIRRLVELALSDHENNLYGRIVWGFRSVSEAQPEPFVKILAEYLDHAKSNAHLAASIYSLYREVLGKEPPEDWGLARVRPQYPDDLFIIPFSAREPFQPENADALWNEFTRALPGGITAERLPTWGRNAKDIGEARIRGRAQAEAVRNAIATHPRLRVGEICPLPVPMQLYLEEMQGVAPRGTQAALPKLSADAGTSAPSPAPVQGPGPIQQRINAAAPGAVVRLEPGLYKESLLINKPLTLEGAGWDKTVIVKERMAFKASEDIERMMAERVAAAQTDAERQEIMAQMKKEFTEKLSPLALTVENARDVVIRGIKFTSPGGNIKGGSINIPLLKFDHSRVQLSDCAVIGGPGPGVHILNGSGAEIERTLVAAVWGTGIIVGPGPSEAGVRIHDCDIRNCYYACMGIGKDASNTVVERCRISGAAWHGIRYDDASPQIVSNLLYGHARFGIYASGQTAASVRDNLFYANEMTGMGCWFQSSDRIEGNTFVNNKEANLAVLGAAKPEIRRNIFYGSPVGISLGNINENSPFAKSEGTVALQDNLFWLTDHEMQLRRDASTTEILAVGADTGTVRLDPGFTAPESKDFSLRADSPARQKNIGAGTLLLFDSPWPLQPEELAIIPKGDTRDYRQWRQPN